jgi:adenine-specific DNA-methyltransferase
MQAQDLIKRVAEYDEGLARDLRKFIGSRKLGLVYEESKPEYVRLWNKQVITGDLVNTLPPRGVVEDLSNDNDEHDVIWHVVQVDNNIAHLLRMEDGTTCDVSLDNVVPVARFDQNIYCGLCETGRVERGGDKPYHAIINGENFHALESLLFAYRGKVDCIYIDPPYNTGAKDWKYNNNYVGSDDRYRHSKWLTFMEDRLRIAKQLLNPVNSVLICTIDEKEYLRLGLLLEELFPEAHIQMISIVINPNGVARDHEMYRLEEYAFFVYIGDSGPVPLEDPLFTSDVNQRKEKKLSDLENINRSQRKVRWEWLMRGGSNSDRFRSPGCFYPVWIDPKKKRIVEVGDALSADQHPSDIAHREGLVAVFPIARGTGAEKVWQMTPDSLRTLVDKGFAKVGAYDQKRDRWSLLYLGRNQRQRIERGEILITGRDANGVALVEEASDSPILRTPKTIWNRQAHSAGEYGSRLLRSMLPGRTFPFPKSLYAVEDVLRSILKYNRDALVLDYFGGSATTIHATMLLNHQDGGHRRCICITNNEVSEKEQIYLTGKKLRQGDAEWERFGIAKYIAEPRVMAAITGQTPDGALIKGNYKFADEFPIADGFEENAIFYDLTYLEPSIVSADLAFDEIAPLLWMRAGSTGPMIRHGRSFELTDSYGVLFDIACSAPFIRACRERSIKSAFVVTDIDAEWRAICRELPGVDVVQLYKHYLRSFEIGAGR